MGTGGYDFFTAFDKSLNKQLDRRLDSDAQFDMLMDTLGIKEGYRQRREKQEVEGYKTALEARDPGRLGAFGTDPGAYEGVTLGPLKQILQGEMDTDKFRAKEEYKTGKKEEGYAEDVTRLGKIYPKATPAELRMAARSPTALAQLGEKYGQETPGERKTNIQIKRSQENDAARRRLTLEDKNFGTYDKNMQDRLVAEAVILTREGMDWYPVSRDIKLKTEPSIGRGIKSAAHESPPPPPPDPNAGGGQGGGLLEGAGQLLEDAIGMNLFGQTGIGAGPQAQQTYAPGAAGQQVNTRPDIPIGTPKHHPNGAISKWDGKGWALDKPAPNAGSIQ